MPEGRYSSEQIKEFAQRVLRDSYCVLPAHFPRAMFDAWREAFAPLLKAHVAREADRPNRGVARHYVTLPFVPPFADPAVYEDADVLAIVESLLGDDVMMTQFASDTPLRGSDYQDVHRDVAPLFPESDRETPPFLIAANFALVDVTQENGHFEVARATHLAPQEEGLSRLRDGVVSLEPLMLKVGDVMIRDVRHLHRGTPNRTDQPRPVMVIGYSRGWLLRTGVSIEVPRAALAGLSPRAKRLLRANPVVEPSGARAATVAEETASS